MIMMELNAYLQAFSSWLVYCTLQRFKSGQDPTGLNTETGDCGPNHFNHINGKSSIYYLRRYYTITHKQL